MSEPNEKKQGQTFIEKKPKKDWQYSLRQLKTPKGIAIIFAVVFGLLIATFLYGEVIGRGEGSYPCTQNTELIMQASGYIDTNNNTELSRLASQINSYEKNQDPTCTAILFWDKLIYRDIDSAKHLLEKIENEYNPSFDRSPKNSLFTNNPSELVKILNGIEESFKQQEENRKLFNEGVGELQ